MSFPQDAVDQILAAGPEAVRQAVQLLSQSTPGDSIEQAAKDLVTAQYPAEGFSESDLLRRYRRLRGGDGAAVMDRAVTLAAGCLRIRSCRSRRGRRHRRLIRMFPYTE